MRYEVTLTDSRGFGRRELFASYEAAMAYFDANRGQFECEFRDLRAYGHWSLRGGLAA